MFQQESQRKALLKSSFSSHFLGILTGEGENVHFLCKISPLSIERGFYESFSILRIVTPPASHVLWLHRINIVQCPVVQCPTQFFSALKKSVSLCLSACVISGLMLSTSQRELQGTNITTIYSITWLSKSIERERI